MKATSLLMIVLLVAVQTELVEFGESAVNLIFKEKKESFVLFTSPDNTEAKEQFTAAASSDSSYVYTIVDSEDNKDHYSRFAEYLGLSVEQTPTLIFMVEASKKYVGDTSDLSVEAFKTFAEKVGSGEIKPFLKSAPIPTDETSAVKTIVGLNFRSVVLESEHEVLLKVYAPWCGHCKTIAPEFEAAAEILAGNSNIILGNFDGTLNEAEEIEIEGYPTILWYGKDKSQQPVKFNGERDKDGIVTWIKDHTEYEWVEAAVAEPVNEDL